MSFVRPPAVAGTFYPADGKELAWHLRAMLAVQADGPVPKAIIVPHAGTIYSGPVAAHAYARLPPGRDVICRVVMIGPAHRVGFHGLAVSAAEEFATPLGRIPVDREGVAAALAIPGVRVMEAAFAEEHSLEVQLPFLQLTLDRFSLVPILAGDATADLAARVLDVLWGGRETLIVVSSDLSHYLGYSAAKALDAVTCAAIERLDADAVEVHQACGRVVVRGLLTVAARRGLVAETVDLRNSGDTAGPRDRVVGYGAWVFTEASAREAAIRRHGALLVAIARNAIAAALGRRGARIPEVLPTALVEPGACFVTLRRNGELRGCVGSADARSSLGEAVAVNAVQAALRDPRFPPLSPGDAEGLEVSVSVLTPLEPMEFASEAELTRGLRPGHDGLVIEDGKCRAVFLPSVWELLPDAHAFVGHLKRKAGLPEDYWSPTLRAYRFAAIEVK